MFSGSGLVLDEILTPEEQASMSDPPELKRQKALSSSKPKPKIKIILNGEKFSPPPSSVSSISSRPSTPPSPPPRPQVQVSLPPSLRFERDTARQRRRDYQHRPSTPRLPRKRRTSNRRKNNIHERCWPPSTFLTIASRDLHRASRCKVTFERLMADYDAMHEGFHCFEDMDHFIDWFGRDRAREFMLFFMATNTCMRTTFNRLRSRHINDANQAPLI